jgi:serine/threonine protein kinase
VKQGEDADERLELWLSEFVERREQGESLTPEDFHREHVDGGEPLLAALHQLCASEALLPSAPFDTPQRIGPYRIQNELGSGGMGRVFGCVHDDRPSDALALKLLHLPLVDQERALERFRREGEALARISHPSVVRVHEAGLFDRRPYIAMERVDGMNLAKYVSRARARLEHTKLPPWDALDLPGEGAPLERVVRIALRVARAIECAHGAGVLHRDLNARNVLVRSNGEPVVIDFGLMRSEAEPTLTGSGDVLGTPQYMSPEQARGERPDERTDVFGVGCLLRELLTLAPPRPEDGTLTLLRVAGSRPIARLRALSPAVPRELAIIVDRATAFGLRWRTHSATELADDLEAWLDGRPIRARAPGVLERAHDAWANQRVAITVGALVVLAGAVAWLAVDRGDGIDPRVLSAQRLNALVVAWLDGDLPRARRHWDEFHAGDPSYPLSEFLDALSADDLSQNAQHPAALALLEGERARRAGRAMEAARKFATAGDVFPGQSLPDLMAGLALLEAGELTAARKKLEDSSYYFGASHQFHRKLSETYRALGATEDAERALRAAEALAPSGEAQPR